MSMKANSKTRDIHRRLMSLHGDVQGWDKGFVLVLADTRTGGQHMAGGFPNGVGLSGD